MKDFPGHELIELTTLGVYVTTGNDPKVYMLASDFDQLAARRADELKRRAQAESGGRNG